MKVLHVINSLSIGGAEKLLVDSCIEYRNAGIEIDILLLTENKTPLLNQISLHKDIKIYSLGKDINIYNPRLIFKLRKYLRDYPIIHVHLFPALYWVSLSNLLFNLKKFIVYTEHSTDNRRRHLYLFKYIDRFIYKRITHVVCISKIAQDLLKSHLGSSFENILVINNGINLNTIRNAKPYTMDELGVSNDTIVLIQVSSFRYPKDQKTVIKALQLLNNNVHLFLVGDGELKQEAIQLADDLGVNERVHFLGIRNDVPRLLKTANIIILSSHYEGLSLSSVEGMASGKPFIASNVQGLKEIVEGAGILFNAEDYTQLAEHINKLLLDDSFLKEVIKKCTERASNYNITEMIDQYIELYSKYSPN